MWSLPHRVVAPRQEPKIPRSYTRIFGLDGTLGDQVVALPVRFFACFLTLLPVPGAAGASSHGFAYFGDLKYPKDMPRFDYAYPDTPKGGTVRMSIVGTFNNLHAYVDKGLVGVALDPRIGTHLYEPLMRKSEDELSTTTAIRTKAPSPRPTISPAITGGCSRRKPTSWGRPTACTTASFSIIAAIRSRTFA